MKGSGVNGKLHAFCPTASEPLECFLPDVVSDLPPAIGQEVMDRVPFSNETGLQLLLKDEFRANFLITSSRQINGDKRLLTACLAPTGLRASRSW